MLPRAVDGPSLLDRGHECRLTRIVGHPCRAESGLPENTPPRQIRLDHASFHSAPFVG